MLNPLIRPSRPIIAYKQWLSERVSYGKVTPVEFLGFKYKHYRTGKPYPFNINGENFVGEIWKCYDEKGNWMECTFKHYIDNSFKTNSSLTSNKFPVEDRWQPNLLTDTLDEVLLNTVNKTKYPNKHLAFINRKNKARLGVLRDIVQNGNTDEKEVAFYMLRHKESPTIATLRAVQRIRNEKSELYNQIIEKINQ